MKWSIAELHRYSDEPLHIQTTLDLNQILTTSFPDTILAVQPVKVDGYVSYDQGDVTISTHVQKTVTVPSSRSLTPVALPLDFSFTEAYVDDPAHLSRYEDDEDNDAIVFVL